MHCLNKHSCKILRYICKILPKSDTMEKVAEGFKGEKAIVTPYNIRNLQRENNITKQLFVSHIGYYPHAENHFRKGKRD